MIPTDKALRTPMIKRMIDKFIDDEHAFDTLSKWEQDFIQSVNDQFDIKGDLSNKQCEILERLYDK